MKECFPIFCFLWVLWFRFLAAQTCDPNHRVFTRKNLKSNHFNFIFSEKGWLWLCWNQWTRVSLHHFLLPTNNVPFPGVLQKDVAGNLLNMFLVRSWLKYAFKFTKLILWFTTLGCFYKYSPPASYALTSYTPTSNGFDGVLTIQSSGNETVVGPYGTDISPLRLSVFFNTQQRLHVKIFDPNNQRWTVPYVVQIPDPSNKPATMDYDFQVTPNPFGKLLKIILTRDVLKWGLHWFFLKNETKKMFFFTLFFVFRFFSSSKSNRRSVV